jgi:DNA-binding CsgD family transcriptional regulator
MAASVIGRDAELAAVDDFVAGISDGASVLVLTGEAGMGKTTIWRTGVARAKPKGVRTLVAAPAESEADLSFAGLNDLLDPVLDEALGPLPAGQRSALSRALVLEDAEGPPPDAHAIGVALLGVLRALAESGPVLVAVDDVQWLDPASASALAYAGRRLRGESVGILLARRTGLVSDMAEEFERSHGDRMTILDVGPLDVLALHRVLSERLGTTLPRPFVAEVAQASGGNPFFAIEIVRTVQRRGAAIEAGQPLPLPDSLHDLIEDRLSALPYESRHFLLAAAAHAYPTVAISEAASGVPSESGLAPALDAGIVELDGSRIRFTHPLLGAGVLEAADRQRRIEVHARLAELLDDPEARAWQLAASVDEPDEVVARTLEGAARKARARGAPRPAALLLERAQELTMTDRTEDAVRRGVEAAFLHFEAGDSQRADAKLREVIAPLSAGVLRARALVVLARIRLYEAPDEARELFEQIIEEAEGDLHTLLLAHEGAAACSLWMFERFPGALPHSETASALAVELDDDALAADVVTTRLSIETLLGKPTAAATAESARVLQRAAAELRVHDQPLVSLAETWMWLDQHERAREALVQLVAAAHELGDENSRPWLLCLLGEAERGLANLQAALELARDAQDASRQAGTPILLALAHALEGHVLAQLGSADEARGAAHRALASGRDRQSWLVASAAIAHLELSLGAASAAASLLEPAVTFARKEGILEPGAIRFVTDLVEALIELQRVEEASELLEWYEGNARRLKRASALANSARCRGLIAASAGDLVAALSAFGEAMEWHARAELPLDRGRTLLALGATQRRLKRRREARATLEASLAIFDPIGAALWVERARAELKRISGRAATRGALTPTEERVAALVAEGKTNKEVAAALFLSDRTVEGHLAHIFGKLDIRHRAEVGRALQTRGIVPSNPGDSPVSTRSSTP